MDDLCPVNSQMRGRVLKTSLSTACLYIYPLRRVFALAKRAGFDGVELAINPEVDIRGGAYAKRLSKEFDLPILTVHPPMFQYPGWGKLHKTVAPYLDRALRVAQEVEAPYLVIHMPEASDENTGIGREFIEKVSMVSKQHNASGTRLAIENRPRFRARDAEFILTKLEDLRAFADAHDLQMTLDTAHVGTWDLDLVESYRLFRGRLVNVHLSDLKRVSPRVEGMPVLHSYVKQHQFPGEGVLPLKPLVERLVHDGYEGPMTYELSPTSLQAWSPHRVEVRLKEAVGFVCDASSQGNRAGARIKIGA